MRPLCSTIPPDQLHVVVALAEGALGRLAYGGERLWKNVVEGFVPPAGTGAVLGGHHAQALAKFRGLATQLLVGKLLELRLERVDPLDRREQLLYLAVAAAGQQAS
jgi:hypothetical protein